MSLILESAMYVPAAKVSEVVRKPKYRSGVGTSANCVTSTKLWSRLGIAFAVAAGKVRPSATSPLTLLFTVVPMTLKGLRVMTERLELGLVDAAPTLAATGLREQLIVDIFSCSRG